ncbi:response regulator transcription factor [Yinghuangia seranimata]|uniref:response regulator transcription factor n=1 Tax=Yinghuangia seranimata TaxID=408067 RepID=UPI00248D3890|nr:response regulator transcription factor [Yinghuangia seranimata]MDI2128624.1 response regulator transcription factor [Yinghuangia seranimata]
MRLLMVEDDLRIATPLRAVLGRHGIDVSHACTGEEALDALTADIDVVLLDLNLPDHDGFEVCARIRRLSAVPVIMVTARADVRSRVHGLNLGADDYVTKPYDIAELLARIHAVSRRARSEPLVGSLPAPAAGNTAAAVGGAPRTAVEAVPAAPAEPPARPDALCVDAASRRVTVRGTEVVLTRKEFDLLALLAQRPGVVFRREQIMSEVWRTSWSGSGRTLEVHVASLRAKLGNPRIIETVRGVGYRIVPDA